MRIERSDGAYVIANAGVRWTIEATNGTFGCDLLERACMTGEGQEVRW